MNYLLDVNVLVAWGWADHVEHRRAAKWIGAMKAARGVRLLTSAIPELGFVRISVQRTGPNAKSMDSPFSVRMQSSTPMESEEFGNISPASHAGFLTLELE